MSGPASTDAPRRMAAPASISRVEARLERLRDLLRLTAEDGAALLVHDGAVVEDVVQLVVLDRLPHLRDEDLDLVRLHLVGEHLPEGLAVGVGERACVHVLAGERVALEVGLAHPGDPQHLELVVLADAGERDAVVDLGDLVERAERVLGDEHDAVDDAEGDEAAAAGDALPRVVGAVLHHLFRRDVEGHAHSPLPSSRPP